MQERFRNATDKICRANEDFESFAIVWYYLFWCYRTWGRHSGGGKPKAMPPGTLK
jgi:hypothetical protein